MGKTLNFPFVKTIKLNEEQRDKFNAKDVRAFLDGKVEYKDVNNQYIVNVLREMFKEGVLKVYGEKLTPQYQTVLEMI